MENNFDWKKYLTECLESTYFCAIATHGKNSVWVNPVYFAYDDKFNFYFISQPHYLHMENIATNGEIAVAIYSTNRQSHEYVTGIQLNGKAIILSNPADIEEAHQVYYAREKNATWDPQHWKFVKIIPEHIYYFDNRFFGEERELVPEEIYKK